MNQFFHELVRRRVLQTTAAYLVSCWVIVEVASVILPTFEAPDVVLRYLIIVLATLTPLVVLLAWFYDITLKGVVFTPEQLDEVERSRTDQLQPGNPNTGAGPAEADDEDISPGEEPAPRIIEVDAERRLVSVLQYSLQPLNPEQQETEQEKFHHQLPEIHRGLSGIIDNFGGFLAPGDSELKTAFFGVDVVHEDGAMRACLSAFEMLGFVKNFNLEEHAGLQISASIALHCGFAIVEPNENTSVDRWISNVGQTLRIVSALQVQAESNEILISESARMMLQHHIQCTPVSTIKLPNSTRLEQVFRITGAGDSGDQATQKRELVGRKKELLFLMECWINAKDAEGQVVFLRGEAGIGKSILVQHICDQAEDEATVLRLQCSAYHQNSSLYPIVQYMKDVVLAFDAQDCTADKVEKLRDFLNEHYEDIDPLLPIFGAILSIDQDMPDIDLVPERRREVLFEAIMKYVVQQARQHSLMILIEDLHWADPTMMELIHDLSDLAPGERFMLLLTHRPSLNPHWGDASHVTRLNVGRLNDKDSDELIRVIDTNSLIGEELRRQIIDKSDGVPLYVEQYTEMVLDSLGKQLEEINLTIPDTLQESMAARLQHLGAAKNVLNLAATIGRDFSLVLLSACVRMDKQELDRHLSELIDCELIRKRGMGRDAEFSFKHALIQEAAYSSMLKSKREEYHQRVGEQIEALQLDMLTQQPEVMARHFGAAAPTEDNVVRAIHYWLKAAGVAIQRSANHEAYAIIDSALSQLAKMSDSPQRDHTELQIQAMRIPILVALQGYASQEMADASERALILCQTAGDLELRFVSMYSICVFYMVSGKHDQAHKTAQLMERMYHDNAALKIETCMLLGLSNFFLGEMQDSLHYLDSALANYKRELHGDHAFLYGQDPAVLSLAYELWAHFAVGNFHLLEGIDERLHEAADSLQHPISSSFCLTFSGWYRLNMGQFDRPQADVEQAMELTSEYRLGNFHNQARILKTILDYRLHGDAALIADMDAAVQAFRADGSRCFLVCWEAYYADACTDAGDYERAELVLDRITRELADTRELWGESEVWRCKGNLALARGDEAQAVAAWQRGCQIAEDRGLAGWGLRNACALARYYKDGDRQLARTTLEAAIKALPDEARAAMPGQARELAASLDIGGY